MHSWVGAVYGGLCLCRGSTAAEAKNAQAADAQRLPIGQCPACQANIARPDVLRKWEIGVTASRDTSCSSCQVVPSVLASSV